MGTNDSEVAESEGEAWLRRTIRRGLRGGFQGDDEVLEGAIELVSDEVTVDETRARAMLAEERAALRAEMATWPATTDCDRLDAAFAELEAAGIVARENFTCCNSCGESEIGDEMEEAEAEGLAVRGYTFFHAQDTDRAATGEGPLMLKYGPSPFDEKKIVPIGREIQAAVERHGLRTEWDGTADQCIKVHLTWQRRRQPRA